MKAGDFIGSYQLQAEAPLDYIRRGSRFRTFNGRMVRGSYSEPWWGYSTARGWAVIRRWKNKEVPASKFAGPAVPAMELILAEPWGR